MYVTRGENVDADNIRIHKIRIMIFDICIHIMRLLSTSARLMRIINADIIRYLHLM
jgi:hypothetical protein